MEPINLFNEARKAVPAVKFALGIAGVAATVALVLGVIKSPSLAVFGTIIMLGLMFILLVFSSIARKSKSAATQVFAYILTGFFVVMIMLTTFFLFTSAFFSYPRPINDLLSWQTVEADPPPLKPESFFRPLLEQKTQAWIDRALLTSQAPNGGIMESPSSTEATTQAWTTAQCLAGVLSTQGDLSKYVPNIKRAFEFIETKRRSAPAEGWNLYGDSTKYTVTEISGWVVLAYIQSLESSTTIWEKNEREQIVSRIERDLAEIVRRQDNNTGGWRPIREEGAKFTRTYSTVVAIWSLLEAHRSPLLRDVVRSRYSNNVREGINWLLGTYRPKQGWVQNPHRAGQVERFDGLTAQTLFVLSRAETLDDFKYVNDDHSYINAQKEFAHNLQFAAWSIDNDNSRIPDSDTRFTGTEFQAEGSTFLWFPWTLLELTHISTDATLPSDDQKTAAHLRLRILNANADKLNSYVEAGNLMYLLGENLFSVATYLRAPDNR